MRVEPSTVVSPASVPGSKNILLGNHGEDGAGPASDSFITLAHAAQPGVGSFQITHLELANGPQVCGGLVLDRLTEGGTYETVFRNVGLGRAGEAREYVGIDAPPATSWRLRPIPSATSEFCSFSRISVYGAVNAPRIPLWHGNFVRMGKHETLNRRGWGCASVIVTTG